MNKTIKKLLIVILILQVAVTGALVFLLIHNNVSKGSTVIETDTEETIEEDNDPFEENYGDKIALWKENKAINSDYVGEIYFTSLLIDDSFVQAKDVYDQNGELYRFYNEDGTLVNDPSGYNGNDVYIWTYWKSGEYDYNDHGGSVFMDYRNDLSDQNLIIYGHHFSVWNDEERIKAFTPLEKLMEEENYAGNETLQIVLEDEVRTYELWAVYLYDVNDADDQEKAQYWRIEYNYDDFSGVRDDSYYQTYIDYVESKRLYDTGVSLDTTDKTLTLQTCISGHAGELFEIVVFRLINVERA